jgi:AraC-like DNA-binding protein
MENKHTFDISAFVCAYDFKEKPRWSEAFEKYDFSQIFIVLSGTGSYSTESATYQISPGMMFYRPAGQSSIYRWDSGDVRFGIISFVCGSEAMKAFEKGPVHLLESELATLLDVIKTGVQICEPINDYESTVGMCYKSGTPDAVLDFIRASLERFFIMVYCRIVGIDLLREQSEKVSQHFDISRLACDVKRFLSEHISSQITVQDICKALGVGQTALMKKFRIETGMGVMEYFTDMKISEAKERIRTTAESFTEIAEKLGFSSVGYFSRVFKQKTGITPTEYSRYVSKHR